MLIFLVQIGTPTLFPKRCFFFLPSTVSSLNQCYLASFLPHVLQSILSHELNYLSCAYDEHEARLEQNGTNMLM